MGIAGTSSTRQQRGVVSITKQVSPMIGIISGKQVPGYQDKN